MWTPENNAMFLLQEKEMMEIADITWGDLSDMEKQIIRDATKRYPKEFARISAMHRKKGLGPGAVQVATVLDIIDMELGIKEWPK